MTCFCSVFIDFGIKDFLIFTLFYHFNPSFDLIEPCVIFFVIFWKFIITKLMLKLSLHGSSAIRRASVSLVTPKASLFSIWINWSMPGAYSREICFIMPWESLRSACFRSGSIWIRSTLVVVNLVETIMHNLCMNIIVALCNAFIVTTCGRTFLSSGCLDISSIDCTLNFNTLW